MRKQAGEQLKHKQKSSEGLEVFNAMKSSNRKLREGFGSAILWFLDGDLLLPTSSSMQCTHYALELGLLKRNLHLQWQLMFVRSFIREAHSRQKSPLMIASTKIRPRDSTMTAETHVEETDEITDGMDGLIFEIV